MYERIETEKSQGYLRRIAESLGDTICLVGGWAVYYTVLERYKRTTGKEYIGSRDIDIGVKDLKTFGEVEMFLIDELNFDQLSFRYVKYLDYDTGKYIPPETAARVPIHMLFELYVDVMMPVYDEGVKGVLGFIPPDEPLLEQIFGDATNQTRIEIENAGITIPSPELLLAMKLNSVGNRTKDHKRIKDMCDIVAISLFSGIDRAPLTEKAKELADPEKAKAIGPTVQEEDIAQCSTVLGIPADAIRSIMKGF